jgi:hypothetical protein
MTFTKTRKSAVCRSRTNDHHGIPWRCDRPQGHTGKHQTHFPHSRTVLKSWARAR